MKIWNLALRFLTIGSKFLLSIYLVKFLGLHANGEYGIYSTTITTLTYLLGMDFYTFSTRSILQHSSQFAGAKLRNQFILFGVVYLFLLPLISGIWWLGFIDPAYIFLFYGILIAEHISTELYRVLIIFSKPVAANVNLFLRSGIWMICLVSAWALELEEVRNLHAVFWFWFGGSFLSIVQSVVVLSTLKLKLDWLEKPDWEWMRTGLMMAFPFFVGTMAFKIVQFADRYLVDYFLHKEATGVYIFFSNISTLVETLVQTTTIMVFSPQLVSSFKEGRGVFDKVYKAFKSEVLSYTLISAAGVAILIFPLIAFLQMVPLYDHIGIFFIMVLTKIVFNMSMIYHYYLYVSHKDRLIMVTTLIAAVVTIALNFVLIPSIGMMGAALSALIGFGLIFALKLYYARAHGL